MNIKKIILVTLFMLCIVILTICALDKTISKCLIIIYIILFLLNGVCLMYDIVKKTKNIGTDETDVDELEKRKKD